MKLTDYNSYELSAGDDAAVFYAIPAPVAVAATETIDALFEAVRRIDEAGNYDDYPDGFYNLLSFAKEAYEEACK